jgi:MFS transporter, FHS family, glucose/mannose:H+ symporter
MPQSGTRTSNFWMSDVDHSAPKALRLRLLAPQLHLGFAFTGVGTVLLGCILPQVSAKWHLSDKEAGVLLLLQFAASAFGSLLVRRNLWKMMASGYGLIALGAISIFLLRQRSIPARETAFVVYGLGLGVAMTATSMFVSRRSPTRRGAALAILNFAWSAGAVACPLLVAQFLRCAGPSAAFGMLGLMVVPFALIPLFAHEEDLGAPADFEAAPTGSREAPIILYFALLAFLYVGIEASLANWMSTYATRVTAWNLARGSIAVAVFWAALLLGRALTAALLTLLSERRLYLVSVVLTAAGISLLLVAHSPPTVLAGSALTGLALGPVFPLILSLFLSDIGKSRNAGWVFAIAGLGGAVLSWLTGTVSSGTGSLRIGLLVPGAASLLMMAMIAWPPATHKPLPARSAN